ncbi:MAG: PAS domain-containing protein [Alphaproteobacteria bacterium]|nr:PAS domain-containing protein [Alphaproteobacteria bacterium]
MIEKQLLAAFDSMSDGMVLLDASDRVVAWNAAYARLVPDLIPHLRPGMSYRDALAVIARIRQGFADQAAIEESIERRLAMRARTGTPFDSPRPDGGITQIVEQRTGNGGWVISYRDVTAERRASAALAEAKVRAERLEVVFRDGIASLTDGFMLLDSEDRIVTWNGAYERFFVDGSSVARVGMTFEDYIRATWNKRRSREPHLDAEAAIRRRIAAHQIIGQPYEIRAVNGMIIRAIVQRTSIGGKVVVFRDITDERRALDAANGIAAEFREGIDNMLDGFAQFDAEKRLLNWNDRYLTMFPHLKSRLRRGLPLAEVFRLHAVSSLYAIEPAEIEAWIDRAVATLWNSAETSMNRALRDGRTVWGISTRTPSGGLTIVIRDVTKHLEQERILAQALEREREVSAQQRRFVAVTAHEFRTPLTIIDGAAQRMIRYAEGIDPKDLRERAVKVRTAVARMSQLIDATLNLARLDAGQIGMTVVPVDLGGLIAAACRRLEGYTPGVAIAVTLPTEPVTVRGDASLLDQVVTNLVSNAVKYSGRSRQVEVAVSVSGRWAKLEVVDHGIGIPEAELERVFERFYRASTAKGLPGTGIGLNLVRELVDLHGGRIAVASRVGEGTRFTVTLPRAAEGMRATPDAA